MKPLLTCWHSTRREAGLECVRLYPDRIEIVRYTRSGRSVREILLAQVRDVSLVKRKNKGARVRVQLSMQKGWTTILRVRAPRRWKQQIEALLVTAPPDEAAPAAP